MSASAEYDENDLEIIRFLDSGLVVAKFRPVVHRRGDPPLRKVKLTYNPLCVILGLIWLQGGGYLVREGIPYWDAEQYQPVNAPALRHLGPVERYVGCLRALGFCEWVFKEVRSGGKRRWVVALGLYLMSQRGVDFVMRGLSVPRLYQGNKYVGWTADPESDLVSLYDLAISHDEVGSEPMIVPSQVDNDRPIRAGVKDFDWHSSVFKALEAGDKDLLAPLRDPDAVQNKVTRWVVGGVR
jgi:hypothetical protein